MFDAPLSSGYGHSHALLAVFDFTISKLKTLEKTNMIHLSNLILTFLGTVSILLLIIFMLTPLSMTLIKQTMI